MGLISDLKELSAWIIGLASLVILLVLVYTRVKKDKTHDIDPLPPHK